MRIRLLGTAAGGGVPQWNCNCPICREARAGTGRVKPRKQSCVAVSADDRNWFLLNASPDLASGIENFRLLHPPPDRVRGSPIQAVLLTNADLDHTLGLFQLREGEKVSVHATASVRRSLEEGLSLSSTLACFSGVDWVEPPTALAVLPNRGGGKSGLLYRAIHLSAQPPRFAKARELATDHVVGYAITDEKTGGRLLFLPDVAAVDMGLRALLHDCDVLLFDGTFWAENEMRERGTGILGASNMGHMRISGAEGSLEILRGLSAKQRIYVHINNTNPILFEDSPERASVVAAGCQVGEDGMEFLI